MFAEVADPKYSPRPSSVTNSHSFFIVPFFPLIQILLSTKYLTGVRDRKSNVTGDLPHEGPCMWAGQQHQRDVTGAVVQESRLRGNRQEVLQGSQKTSSDR